LFVELKELARIVEMSPEMERRISNEEFEDFLRLDTLKISHNNPFRSQKQVEML
jgi:hypothetical protein